jgi:addiction module HigA family antidote
MMALRSASASGRHPSRISELVHDTRPVTADTALRLGLFFGMEPRFWLNLQTEYDMRVIARTLEDKITPRIHVFYRAAACSRCD